MGNDSANVNKAQDEAENGLRMENKSSDDVMGVLARKYKTIFWVLIGVLGGVVIVVGIGYVAFVFCWFLAEGCLNRGILCLRD